MTVQMVRVTGWSDGSYWYAGKAGQVFSLLASDLAAGEYITREPSGLVNIIKFTDAEVVDVLPAAPTCASPACSTTIFRSTDICSPYQIVIEVGGDDLQRLSPGEWRDVARGASDFLCRFLEGKGIGLRYIRPA